MVRHPDAHLQELNLQRNNISAEGLKLLVEPIAQNTRLRRVDLYNNPIGDFGAELLAHALRTNSTLVKLALVDAMDPSKETVGPLQVGCYSAIEINAILEGLMTI